MKRLLACLRLDLRRAVFSLRFLAAVLGFALLLDLNLPREPWPAEAPYLFSLTYKYGFYIFFFLCAVIPYAGSYLADMQDGYLKCLVRRVPLWAYSLSKCLTVLLSGALANLLGTGLFIADLYLRFPAHSAAGISYSGWDTLLSQGAVAGYFLTKALLTALLGGTFATLALLLSTIIKNSFVVLAAPLLLYYFLNELTLLLPLPVWSCPTMQLYVPAFPAHVGSLAYFAAVQLAVFALSTLGFHSQMRRLRCHGYRS